MDFGMFSLSNYGGVVQGEKVEEVSAQLVVGGDGFRSCDVATRGGGSGACCSTLSGTFEMAWAGMCGFSGVGLVS